jgi:phosphoglycolate phosphatase
MYLTLGRIAGVLKTGGFLIKSERIIGFDFDQTLADSAAGIENCLQQTCLTYGAEVEKSVLEKLARSGLKLEAMLQGIIPKESLSRARDTFMEAYPELGISGTSPMPGAIQLIQRLRTAGHKLVMISAKSSRNLELSMKHLKFEFDEVYGDASGDKKTECILKSNTEIYIGDQESDVVAAVNAGIVAILVNQKPPTFNLVDYPCHYFENLWELISPIEQLIKMQGVE